MCKKTGQHCIYRMNQIHVLHLWYREIKEKLWIYSVPHDPLLKVRQKTVGIYKLKTWKTPIKYDYELPVDLYSSLWSSKKLHEVVTQQTSAILFSSSSFFAFSFCCDWTYFRFVQFILSAADIRTNVVVCSMVVECAVKCVTRTRVGKPALGFYEYM